MPVIAVPITSNAGDLPSYVSLADYAALGPQLPALPRLAAAADNVKLAAFVQATCDIDTAMAYQGRRYEADQATEFPRVIDPTLVYAFDALSDISDELAARHVWDWDTTERAAVVPTKVKLATIFQADAIVSGVLKARLDRAATGLTGQSTGSLSESYAQPLTPGDLLPLDKLCPRSLSIMSRYEARSGGLL